MTLFQTNTQLLTEISVSTGTKDNPGGHIEVLLSTNNQTVIRTVTVFAEGIFEGETLVIHPRSDQVTSTLRVPLVPPKDTSLDIHIRRRSTLRVFSPHSVKTSSKGVNPFAPGNLITCFHTAKPFPGYFFKLPSLF
ncbi:Bardet-Biedl syndrome 2 protein [Homalodisca vitripennis]|nr:Bardet-Biedl syndrome 2 protein [Homalodisca vitripennis]